MCELSVKSAAALRSVRTIIAWLRTHPASASRLQYPWERLFHGVHLISMSSASLYHDNLFHAAHDDDVHSADMRRGTVS